MRILLDECVPRPLKRRIKGHNAVTVVDLGWAGKRNGDLIRAMKAEKFDLFLTIDQNLPYQQNLLDAGVSVILMIARSNRLEHLLPLVPAVLTSIDKIKSGELVEVRESGIEGTTI